MSEDLPDKQTEATGGDAEAAAFRCPLCAYACVAPDFGCGRGAELFWIMSQHDENGQ